MYCQKYWKSLIGHGLPHRADLNQLFVNQHLALEVLVAGSSRVIARLTWRQFHDGMCNFLLDVVLAETFGNCVLVLIVINTIILHMSELQWE